MSNSPTSSTPTTPSSNEMNKWTIYGVLGLFGLTLPVIVTIVILAGPPVSNEAKLAKVAAVQLTIPQLSPGEQVYQDTCKVCHGPDAKGVVGLGKPLRNSTYVQESDDNELFNNIAEGRFPDHPLNTSGLMMPARGGQSITDDQINDVMGYLRSIQDPSQPQASIEAWIKPKSDTPEIVFDGPGRDLYVAMCSSCHGPNGEGMDGLGLPFTTSAFIKDSTDKEIIMLVKMGRPIWDPANTTGVDMPSKGGNPAMSDDDLNNIITYIRSISTLED